ncbi:UDP-N-acetylmuramoyl-tripeptide--D-alanyl-D-alanine ligase [Elizabethkingia sp. JS20170427COW]|uniref:UDP-N-acetylmuramoyl-tripeptide--D-alanyl-D- alanine ligase n=1 Tax=Elizabethkingia sp. JS20170427COW TaxID=2583851 RepID=UPI0011104E3A|nr:UDP-N-acetylmuramoyl-tripeptide--D-alanyl-D-alanine ligase [Elizabethkingia sp. JS20170427COW]QCX53863.1 UDP-N-acetylmuramoyl-tripeptide--D-alanyl-D-alanine ligase [Elizabethkingia sp. JS20170427COW]
MNIEELYSYYTASKRALIDSRKIEKGDLFFAFSGENFDAAQHAEIAIEKGATAVVVENEKYQNIEKNIFYFPSTLTTLQELAKHHRKQLNIPIIGLTGSNGKTTTKELIHAVLAEKYQVQYTQGNLNNHIGVPLTLLSITPEYEMAVIEMGANHQKEIELLCNICQPDYGYITNFGKAHLEGFGGFAGVIKGKSELYDYLKSHHKTILVNKADDIQKEKTAGYSPIIQFGSEDSEYQYQILHQGHTVGVIFDNIKAISQLTGDYNYNNLCAAITLGKHFGVESSAIKAAIESYTPTNMRSQIVEKEGKTLVLDTYNANPSSMEASLKNFAQYEGSKTIIIGDMLELGDESKAEHEKILQLAKELSFENIITVGAHFKEINSEKAFSNTQEAETYLQSQPISTQNILLKGSRGIALEKLIPFL